MRYRLDRGKSDNSMQTLSIVPFVGLCTIGAMTLSSSRLLSCLVEPALRRRWPG